MRSASSRVGTFECDMKSECCNADVLANKQCSVCGDMVATIEDVYGILHNIEALLPRLEGDTEIKVAILQLLSRTKSIVARL